MSRTLRSAGRPLVLARFGEPAGPGERLRFSEIGAARALVAGFLADPRDAEVLRRVAGELAHGAPVSDASGVVERIAAALLAGRLALVRPEPARPLRLRDGLEEGEKALEPDSFDLLQKPQETHWIEIQIVGEDGVGIPSQRYLIVTGDGREHRGWTDPLGVARLNRIPAGTCRVSFPDLDAEAWETLSTPDA